MGLGFDSRLGTFWVCVFARFGVFLLHLGPVLCISTFIFGEFLIFCTSMQGESMVSTEFSFYASFLRYRSHGWKTAARYLKSLLRFQRCVLPTLRESTAKQVDLHA